MSPDVKSTADLFLRNATLLYRELPHTNHAVCLFGAGLYSARGKTVNLIEAERCMKQLKSEYSVVSPLRGTVTDTAALVMAASDTPKLIFERAKQFYVHLEKKLSGSPYMMLVALYFVSFTEKERYRDVAERVLGLYRHMQDKHPITTSVRDVMSAALLTGCLSSSNSWLALDESEHNLRFLKKAFGSRDTTRALAMLMACSAKNAKDKCERVVRIYEECRAAGIRYGRRGELTMLGMLSFLDDTPKNLANELVELSLYLKENKEFSRVSLARLSMYAAFLLAVCKRKNHDQSLLSQSLFLRSTLALILQQSMLTAEATPIYATMLFGR